MIIFDNVSKAFPRPGGGKKVILDRFTAAFRARFGFAPSRLREAG